MYVILTQDNHPRSLLLGSFGSARKFQWHYIDGTNVNSASFKLLNDEHKSMEEYISGMREIEFFTKNYLKALFCK